MKNISMLINTADKRSHINPEIYGHFSEHLGRCIYNGMYVGENSEIPNIKGVRKDVIEAFKEIKMPVLRWPGGCFADEYHWKDGIGEKTQRKKMINTNWGGVSCDIGDCDGDCPFYSKENFIKWIKKPDRKVEVEDLKKPKQEDFVEFDNRSGRFALSYDYIKALEKYCNDLENALTDTEYDNRKLANKLEQIRGVLDGKY